MVLTDPTPLAAFCSTSPAASAFDHSGKTWYEFGRNFLAPRQPIVSNRKGRWVEANEYPADMYLSRQYPMWNCIFRPTGGYSIYQTLGGTAKDTYSDGSHVMTFSGTPTSNALRDYTLHYLNKSDSQTAWSLFWAKSVALTLELSLGAPMLAHQTWFGRVPWIYNNSYAADGIQAISNVIDSDPSDIGTTPGFVIDSKTSITYAGSSWSSAITNATLAFNRGCKYVHTNNLSQQQSVWPSAIFEGNNIIPLYVDLYVPQGRDNTIIEDIYDTAGKTTSFLLKFYVEGSQSQYLQIENNSGTAFFHSDAEMNVPLARNVIEAEHIFRFAIRQPKITVVDGCTTDYDSI